MVEMTLQIHQLLALQTRVAAAGETEVVTEKMVVQEL
jgi:hypothetical protein